MTEPLWVSREVVLATHGVLLARFGGLPGIRDEGLLDSALNRPRQLHSFGTPTLFELAASYAAGIVKNHPFLDGNKRTGFMVAYIFLAANGQDLEAAEEEVVTQTLALADGTVDGADYATWLRRTCAETDRGP